MLFSRNTYLRYKIFVAIVLLNFLFMIFMAAFNFYRDSIKINISKKQELITTENKVQETYNYFIRENNPEQNHLDKLLSNRIFEISNINNVSITLYDLSGKVITSSRNKKTNLEQAVLEEIAKTKKINNQEHSKNTKNAIIYSSYSYLLLHRKPIAIVNTETAANKNSLFFHFKILIKQYLLAIIFLLILSGYAAWFISKTLTKKIGEVSRSLNKTNVEYLDTPIKYNQNDEIKPLIESYNNMLLKLQEQTDVLTKVEREEAWRDMAKQMAHEINNPLTPLKLSVQNFQRKYNPEDANNEEKVRNLTKLVVNQIDVISSITKSFSDFAKMPTNNDSLVDVVKTIKFAVDIFPEDVINFSTNAEELYYKIDSIYLTRIVTNVVKNALQSITHQHKKVMVDIRNFEEKFIISIQDNGSGIPDEYKEKVFEQKFTTKSTGMGIGLYMVKQIVEDYGGKIWFETELEKGTTFFIEFFKDNK